MHSAGAAIAIYEENKRGVVCTWVADVQAGA